jgi:hypothetical protein
MHWYREGNRQRSRILYVFRTPGGVRVGRNPFEPEVIKQIEAEHPDIDFDWDVVRENQQVVEVSPELRRRRPRREGEPGAAPAAEAPAPPPEPPPPPPAAAPLPAIPSTIEGSTPDEQIAFLTQWHPIIRERILMRTALEPARLEMLLALADRLNPGAWTDADQITAGLQQAVDALERLSHVLAKRRRRSRRKPPRPPGAAPMVETASESAAENGDGDGGDADAGEAHGFAEPAADRSEGDGSGS